MLGGFSRMVGGVVSVPTRYMSVMTSFFVISGFVMRGSFTMVFRSVLVMLRRFQMMLNAFVSHTCISFGDGNKFQSIMEIVSYGIVNCGGFRRRNLQSRIKEAQSPRMAASFRYLHVPEYDSARHSGRCNR